MKVSVELSMESRCAETPGVLCGFAVSFFNIPANLLGLILKHTIIHLCLSKSKVSCQNLYFWWFMIVYLFNENCCSLWEILFSCKSTKIPNVNSVELWPLELKKFSLSGSFWFYHPKTLGRTGVIFKQHHYEDCLPYFLLDYKSKDPFTPFLSHSLSLGLNQEYELLFHHSSWFLSLSIDFPLLRLLLVISQHY